MLIIAIPKSASTSLQMTLEKYQGIKGSQTFYKDFPNPENCSFLSRLHSDIRELTTTEADKFNAQDHIYKQHIFPSPNNIKLFHDVKKVILLRNPTDILSAYRRGALKGVHNLIPGFETSWDEHKWIEKASEVGLLADLELFYSKWMELANQDNTLIIDYKDYVDQPKDSVNKIEAFYGLPITNETIDTVKARYSRKTKLDSVKEVVNSFPKKIKSSLYRSYKKIRKK